MTWLYTVRGERQ